MEKKRSGKKVILIIVIAFFLGISFPNFLLSMQRINLAKKTDEIIKPFEDAAFEYNGNKLFADEKIYEFAKKCDAQKKECIIFTNDRPLRTSIKCSFDNDTIKALSWQDFAVFAPKLPAPPEIMIDTGFIETIESEKYRREWYEQNGLEYFGI